MDENNKIENLDDFTEAATGAEAVTETTTEAATADEPTAEPRETGGAVVDFEEEDRINRNNTLRAVAIALGCVLAAGLLLLAGWFGWKKLSGANDKYFMTFEKQKISVEDYKLMELLLDSGYGVEEGAVVEWLQDLCIYMKAAEDYAFSLSADEKSEVDGYVSTLREQLTSNLGDDAPDVKDDRLAEIISGSFFAEKVYNLITENVGVGDEAAYEEAYADYRANASYNFVDMTFKYIFGDEEDEITEAAEAITNGAMSFDEAAKEFSQYYDEESDAAYTITPIELANIGFPEDTLNALVTLDKDALSEPLYLTGGFLLLQAMDKSFPPEDDIRAEFKEIYLNREKSTMFEEWLMEQRANADFKINRKALDKIHETADGTTDGTTDGITD